jgi:hypothetical protein
LGDASGDTLTVTGGTTTFTQGTANGVAYLNGSKVLTTGTALVFDGSNLGIGTTSPSGRLHVNSTGAAIAYIQSTLAAGNTNVETRYVSTNRSWGVGQNIIQTSSIFEIADVTAGATRLAIDSSGNLLVGTTSTAGSERLNITGSVANQLVRFYNSNASPSGIINQYTGAAPNGTGNEFLQCYDNASGATLRMSSRSNGGIANYSGNNVNLSDRREKTNFAPASSYLDKICAIPVQTFNYIDQNLEDDGGLTLGVVAQDVQAVAPELVMESDWSSEKDGSKMRLSIYQTDLQYALMKCIQEQQAIITSLTDRITALEAPATGTQA